MKPFRQILVAIAVLFVVAGTAVYLIAPVWMSFSANRNAPPVTRIVPKDLTDLAISHSLGQTLSYFGYTFEIPWDDLDESKSKSSSNLVILTFRSGLRMMVGAEPPGFWVRNIASNFKSSPAAIQKAFGIEPIQSDYYLLKTVYEFSPDKMNLWTSSARVRYYDSMLLILKAAALSRSAESGIFNLQNQTFKGFQQGNPLSRPTISVELFSDVGNFTFTILQKDYANSVGVSQADVNRIVQTVHKSN